MVTDADMPREVGVLGVCHKASGIVSGCSASADMWDVGTSRYWKPRSNTYRPEVCSRRPCQGLCTAQAACAYTAKGMLAYGKERCARMCSLMPEVCCYLAEQGEQAQRCAQVVSEASQASRFRGAGDGEGLPRPAERGECCCHRMPYVRRASWLSLKVFISEAGQTLSCHCA